MLNAQRLLLPPMAPGRTGDLRRQYDGQSAYIKTKVFVRALGSEFQGVRTIVKVEASQAVAGEKR